MSEWGFLWARLGLISVMEGLVPCSGPSSLMEGLVSCSAPSAEEGRGAPINQGSVEQTFSHSVEPILILSCSEGRHWNVKWDSCWRDHLVVPLKVTKSHHRTAGPGQVFSCDNGNQELKSWTLEYAGSLRP